MGAIVQRALQMKMLRTENKNIRLENRIEPDLPQIWGNINQLFQCCVEIIGNAIDALEEVGGGTFSVSVIQEGDELVMEFSDSGPGIRDPQRIFDPFYTTKAVGKGMGLGLSVTYGVVQDHQGQISCENRPEGGAVFVLRFPVAKQSAPSWPRPPQVVELCRFQPEHLVTTRLLAVEARFRTSQLTLTVRASQRTAESGCP